MEKEEKLDFGNAMNILFSFYRVSKTRNDKDKVESVKIHVWLPNLLKEWAASLKTGNNMT